MDINYKKKPSWHSNYLDLAEKLVLHIDQVKVTTFDKLEVRALKHGISMNVFDQAIARLHKLPNIKRTVKLGTVQYELQAVKVKANSFNAFAEWRKDNPYPVMDSTNDCHHEIFAGIDLSFMFMTPEEAELYRAEMKGQRVFKKKKYEHA